MFEAYISAKPEFFSHVWTFPETVWRHMNCHQATHVFEPNFQGFPMNRLAIKCDPPGDVYCFAQFVGGGDFSDN